ncbi:hypothetical protein [Bacteroides sp. 224]|uniref:hypothetical protein n=1 Tax=Bacteroides sp. 224 TaxID=2302936 RepID=UPI0013D381EE|nr:hypothetical protein [Bacteroides sp. 224]NDV66791.1 hypothetical protein [Bacteroides sp. 224]
MDSNIKKLLSFILFLLLNNSCSFDDEYLYEIKINDWASISYNIINNDSASITDFKLYAYPDKVMKIDKRIKHNGDEKLRKREVLENCCTKLVYNDSIILILDGLDKDTTSSLYVYNKYYKIEFQSVNGGMKEGFINKQVLSEEQFYSMSNSCKKCKVVDVGKLRKI